MTQPAGSGETTQWRAWGESWVAALIPGVAVLGGVVFLLQAASLPGGWSPISAVLGLFGVVLVAGGTFLLVVLLRTRTRLTPDGIEIRQIKAEVLPWSRIANVQLDRRTGKRTVTVLLHDGRVRTLPTPVQAKRPQSDPTLRNAVAAMRRRLDDGAGRRGTSV